jgi:glutamyl-tRNA synthetase
VHLGNARTALFNFLYARRTGGRFVLRSEDTDEGRSDDALLAALCDDLRWLGLAWDEGPDVGGPRGPYRQSERGVIYATHFERLEAAGRAYPCFCTPEELAVARRAQQAARQPPRYPGTCRKLSAAERAARAAAGDPATLRFAVDPERVVEFDDLVHGPRRFAARDLGDFVIRRADGSAAFLFSNALDDALMEITHVLRGEDHLSNTPRQLLLLEALGMPAPRYGHLPLVHGEDGAPLSKRTGGVTVRALREEGVLPEALCNHLARLGHALASGACMSLAELAESFELGHLGRAPARHDPAQLRHWQREAVHAAGAGRLWRWMSTPELDALVPAAEREQFVATVKPNVETPADALAWARRLYADPVPCTDDARAAIRSAGEAFWADAVAELAPEREFRAGVDALATRSARRGRALYLPLRAALTGATDGPELARVFTLLGPRARARLEAARELAR